MRDTKQAQQGKRWAVLGDIFEVGTFAREEHRASGRALAETVDYLVAIGDAARFYVEGAIEAGMPEQHTYYYCANVDNTAELEAAKRAAAELLTHTIQSDDLVLL